MYYFRSEFKWNIVTNINFFQNMIMPSQKYVLQSANVVNNDEIHSFVCFRHILAPHLLSLMLIIMYWAYVQCGIKLRRCETWWMQWWKNIQKVSTWFVILRVSIVVLSVSLSVCIVTITDIRMVDHNIQILFYFMYIRYFFRDNFIVCCFASGAVFLLMAHPMPCTHHDE